MSVELLTPAAEPILTRDEAKHHLRLEAEHTHDDAYIDELVLSAAEYLTKLTNQSFVTETWVETLDAFPAAPNDKWWDGTRQMSIAELNSSTPIVLCKGPVRSITSIKTTDKSNTQITVDPNVYTLLTGRGEIHLNDGKQWPTGLRSFAAVEIIYACGYGTREQVIRAAKIAARQLVAHWYETREPITPGMSNDMDANMVPHSVQSFINNYRKRSV